MGKATARTRTEQLQDLVDEYRSLHDDEAGIDLKEVATWALRTGRAEPSRVDKIQMLARDLARAERQEYITDPSGERVRRNHAVRSPQGTLWAPIETASADHMLKAAQQRRTSISFDCRQLSTDVNSWNQNYREDEEPKIQLSFDFTNDVEEANLSAEYGGTNYGDEYFDSDEDA